MMDEQNLTATDRTEIDAFLADIRTIRFVDTCDENWHALGGFMDAHSLPITRDNMVFAYESLVKEGTLQLVPFATPISAPEPAPQPVAMPAPVPSKRPFIVYRNGRSV